jgi:hypothetical protein
MNDLRLARISSLSNEVGLYVVLLEVLLFMLKKGMGSVYDKWNISVVIVTQIFHYGEPRHGGDRKTVEVMASI